MSRRFVITILTLIVILAAASVAILLAKGYTFSPKDKRIVGTGIISITSEPDAASVFIDGHLTTATDATIPNLPPKEYTVRVLKDRFIPWEKKITVKEGLVTDLKVTLFPAQPTLFPLTSNGIKNPVLSPDGSKLAYVVPTATESASVKKKSGVWVWTLESNTPIAFARGAEPHQISRSDIINYDNAKLKWSSDSKQVLATVGNDNLLLDEGNLNEEPRDITPILDQTLKSWDDDEKAKDKVRIVNLKNKEAKKIASASATLKWSPDETKFMYTEGKVGDKPEKVKVYDLEENKQYDIPDAKAHIWLPSSTHIILVEDGLISTVEFDGTNKSIIYGGQFEDSLVFVWPDSSKIVFITSFPTVPTASIPNLYGVNLK